MDVRPAKVENSRPLFGWSSGLLQEPSRSFPSEEDKFRTLAENLPQMIFTCDASGRKNYCCQRYLDYTGFASLEEVDRSWLKIIHPDESAAVAALWREAVETTTTYMAQYRMRRYDGVFRHHLARAVPTLNAEGGVTGWVGTITDINEEKSNEALLRRTEKLAAAGRMASSLAHEINNPLSSVTNALFLALQDPALSDATRQYLKLADRELARVARVTSHSLRFHQQSSDAQSVCLSEIIDSVLAVYHGRIQALSIYLDRQYRTNEKLYCRVDDLRQAFSHLLSNALDAMPQGGRLQIRVRLAHRWDGEGTSGFRVIVADTGLGISPDFLPRAFEAFTSTKDATATGLGLWVVDGIVRRHKGSVSVRSRTGTPHHGTVISLFFPFLGATD